MTEHVFGTLEEVDLREAWHHEAHSFTPRLAENLSRLSNAIGIPIELVGQEVDAHEEKAASEGRFGHRNFAMALGDVREGGARRSKRILR